MYFNELIKGEGPPLFNKKCNIVFSALDNVFWQETVTIDREIGVNILVPGYTSQQQQERMKQYYVSIFIPGK